MHGRSKNNDLGEGRELEYMQEDSIYLENWQKREKTCKHIFMLYICGVSSRYPYKVGDHKSPKSKKITWEAELGHTAF